MQQWYNIVIKDHLGGNWTDWFEGMAIRDVLDEQGQFVQTVLSGPLDHAALHGILNRIRDLGLTLISVSRAAE